MNAFLKLPNIIFHLAFSPMVFEQYKCYCKSKHLFGIFQNEFLLNKEEIKITSTNVCRRLRRSVPLEFDNY